jgi:phage baseplate assembly protein gpV
MHSSHPIHRALVTFSNSTTGEIRVKIPALLGADSEVAISYIGRKAPWVVPTVGDQIVVTSDDENLTNIFWVQTDQIAQPTTSTTFDYKIGDTGPGGGVIFFVDRFNEYAGFTYLEVGLVETQGIKTWAPSSPVNYQATAVSGADSKALGGGYQNTIDIVAQGHTNTATSAAKYCDALVSGGKSDWYLPSIGELSLVVSVVYYQLGVGDFVDSYYWSSTEVRTNPNLAYLAYLPGSLGSSQKSAVGYVRPVRRF